MLESLHDLVSITHELVDFGIVEQGLRPGMEACYLLHTWVKFYGDDLFSIFARFDGCVPEARCRIQYKSGDRCDSCDLPQSILHGINIFDTVHHKASDQHAGRSTCRHEATHTVCIFREHLYGSDGIAFHDVTIDLRFADLLCVVPIQTFTVWKFNTFGSECHCHSCKA